MALRNNVRDGLSFQSPGSMKASLRGCKSRGALKLVKGILHSWSVGCFYHRAGPEEAGYPPPFNTPSFVSMTGLLHL